MFHSGVRGFGLALVLGGLVVSLAAAGVARTLETRLWLAAAGLLAAGCCLRSSIWVEATLALASLTALFIAARPQGSVSAFRATWVGIAVSWVDAALAAIVAVPWLGGGVRKQIPGTRRLLRGGVIALGLVGVLGALLASADPYFASFFQWDVNDMGTHVVLLLGGASVAAWLIRRGLSTPPNLSVTVAAPVSATDVSIALAAVTALFSMFVTTQMVAAAGMAAATLRAQGITFSDYARSGYFQLLGVVGVILFVLPWARAAAAPGTRRERRVVAAFSLAVVALTGFILYVAVRRLSLYDDAYGLTMLRLFSLAGAAFMAVLLLLLAASAIHTSGRWFPAAAACALMVTVTGFALINPEAFVASYNLSRRGPVALDRDYLLSLSPDATAILVPALGRGPCGQVPSFDWRTWTVGDLQAEAACR